MKTKLIPVCLIGALFAVTATMASAFSEQIVAHPTSLPSDDNVMTPTVPSGATYNWGYTASGTNARCCVNITGAGVDIELNDVFGGDSGSGTFPSSGTIWAEVTAYAPTSGSGVAYAQITVGW